MPTYVLDPNSPTKILDAATATGAGSMYALPPSQFDGLASNYTWQVITTGAPASLSVKFEGSNDGGNTWATLDTSTQTGGELRAVANTPVTLVRANVATLTGGTSPTVTVIVQVGR